MVKKVLILDGDSIAFRCSAVGEQRSVIVTHLPTGIQKSFKHKTAFKAHMEQRNKEVTADYSLTDHQEPEPVEFVLNTIKNHIKRVVDEVSPDEVKIFTGEVDNFRLNLALPSKYKGQRTGIRPVHLKAAKDYIAKKYNAPSAVGYEVDDLCSIVAYEAIHEGKQPLMYFYEKDQYQLDGVTLVHDGDVFTSEVVPELGEIRFEGTAVKGLGLKFLAYQWVCSDPVDNYCAYELSNVRFGPKSAYNLLKDCKTEREVLVAVKNQFQKFYPEVIEYTAWDGIKYEADWLSMLRMYYKACRMMRSRDDRLEPLDLFNKYGVKL